MDVMEEGPDSPRSLEIFEIQALFGGSLLFPEAVRVIDAVKRGPDVCPFSRPYHTVSRCIQNPESSISRLSLSGADLGYKTNPIFERRSRLSPTQIVLPQMLLFFRDPGS